jgi:Protein of unknown function (DUF2911)
MSSRVRLLAGLLVGCASAPCVPLAAQVRASERAIVTQTADGTVLTINYARPRVRGRTPLFGRVVHWDEVWTPGANWATTLDVNRDVSLDGHPVKKGKYSVWFVVRPGDWTVVLDTNAQRYHTEPPDSEPGQLRWSVKPADGEFTEALTWSFPEVRPDGAVLLFAWGPKRVMINAIVQPSHPIPIARADAEPYLGTYEWTWAESGPQPVLTFELYYADGMIRQRHTPFPDWYPLLQQQPMVRINDDWFIPAIVRDGKLYEMVSDMVFEFAVTGGKAMSFEIRDDRDHLLGTGKRVTAKTGGP